MSHHVYNTEAFVLGGLPVGESSRFVYLFTKDLGLIGARAQNARSVNSKLRFSLDDLSLSKVSLVRGKNSWRLTNALFEKSLFKTFRHQPETLFLCANIFATVKKLVAGEETNAALYGILHSAFDFLEKTNTAHNVARDAGSSLTSEDLKNFEAILMIRILHNLGYFNNHNGLGHFVAGKSDIPGLDVANWSRELLSEMQKYRSRAILVINESLKASHL